MKPSPSATATRPQVSKRRRQSTRAPVPGRRRGLGDSSSIRGMWRADATMARRAGTAESSAGSSGRRARPAFQSAGVALRMSWWSMADARFLLARALGLARRAATSLRSRGLRASVQRAWATLRPPPRDLAPVLRTTDGDAAPASVPASPAPRASIVIPVHGQLAHTLGCLRALAAWPPDAAVEVIVADDASADATGEVLPGIRGLRYHRRDSNGGFIAACNDGAALATGEYLVFLNNDTVPQPGWLDALLATFDREPGTGMAGAQLLYPDGRLQEAGGV